MSLFKNIEDGKGLGKFGEAYSGASKGMQEALGAVGNMVGSVAGGAIGGGLSSGAGNIIGGLGKVASAIPGPWGAVASAGLGIIGGLTNRAFGSKLNQEEINKVNQNTSQMNSFTSNAGSFDALSDIMSTQPVAAGFSKSDIGKDGWFSSKAKKKYQELKRQQENAQLWVDNSIANNAENLQEQQALNALANFAAFGGPLHTNGSDWNNGIITVGTGGTHEQNPYSGVMMGIAPDGVPNLVEEGEVVYNDYVYSNRLKVPKTVMDKYKLKGKKGMTFAEAAEKAQKESEERPNDPISKRSLDDIMGKLMMEQETIRQRKEARKLSREYGLGGLMYAKGGPMGIMYEGNGQMSNMLRNSKASQSEYWDALMGEQLLARMNAIDALEGDEREKAIDDFIKENHTLQDSYFNDIYNSGATWGGKALKGVGKAHQELWQNAGYNNYTDYDKFFGTRNNTSDRQNSWVDDVTGDLTLLRNQGDSRYLSEGMRDKIRALGNKLGIGYDQSTTDGNTLMYFNRLPKEEVAQVAENTAAAPVEQKVELPKEVESQGSNAAVKRREGANTDFNKRDPLTALRYAPAIGAGIGVFSDLMGWTNKPDYSNANAILDAASGVKDVRATPIGDYMRYTPLDRLFYANQLGAQAAGTRRGIINSSGMNRGQAMAGLLAADYNAQNSLGNLYRQAEEYNLGQRERVATFNRGTNMFNAENNLKAQIASKDSDKLRLSAVGQAAALRQAADDRAGAARSANLTNLFDSLGNIGIDAYNRADRDMLIKSGVYGTLSQRPQGWSNKRWEDYQKVVQGTGYRCGGKLRKKKKGLTI